MRKPSRRSARLLLAAIAAPLFMLAVAQPASAAEVAPLGQYIDDTVAGVDEMVLGVATALFG